MRFQAVQEDNKSRREIHKDQKKTNKLGILHNQLNSDKERITYIEHNRR